MIDKHSPVPIYYQIKQLIKRQIEEGALPPGEKLPTEQMLCDRYGVSRAPVRQALLELVQEGYIYRRAGAGTFVSGVPRPTSPAVKTIRLLAYDVRWVALLQQAVHLWNAQHPEQQVALDVHMPPQSEFHRLLCAEVGEGNAHDLFSMDYVWLTRYARMGFLMALDDVDAEYATWLRSQIEAPVLQSNQVDGKLYGLPVQTDVTGVWYRRDWFAAEGLRPPETWDELLAVLAHLARPEVRARYGYAYPLAFPTSTAAGEATFNVLLAFLCPDGNGITATDEAVLLNMPCLSKGLAFLQRLTQAAALIPPDHATQPWWGPPGALAEGRVAMTFGGTYEWPTIAETSGWEGEAELLEHLAFIPAPRPTRTGKPIASLGGTTLGFSRQSEHLDLVLAVLRLALEPAIALPFFLRELQIAPLRPLNTLLLDGTHPWLETIIPLLRIARSRPQLTDYIQFSRLFQLMIEEVLCQGVEPEVALRQLSKTLNILFTK